MLHTVTAGKKTSERGTVVECIVVTTVLEIYFVYFVNVHNLSNWYNLKLTKKIYCSLYHIIIFIIVDNIIHYRIKYYSL